MFQVFIIYIRSISATLMQLLQFILNRERSQDGSSRGGFEMLTVAHKGGGGLSVADVSKNT